MTRNLPSLRTIALDPATLVGLSLDALDALLADAEAENKIARLAALMIRGHVESVYAAHIAAAYKGQGKDFGTVRIGADGYEIVVDTPKKVEWDQDRLQAAGDSIAASGDDPSEYLEIKLTVPEGKYAAWPAHIRAVFEPARTVKPGARTLKLVRKEAA